MFRVCVIVMLVAACGPKTRMEPEPPWVEEYKKLATEGCACQEDPDCVEAAHAAAAKMEAEHGGIDQVPPSVHEAHGELDRCWREGTRDLGRDLAEAADTVCRCSDVPCIEKYRLEVIQIEGKYGVTVRDSDLLDAPQREALARAASCIDGFTIPADEYLAAIRGVADTLCKCDAIECWGEALRARPPSFGSKFYVAEMASIQSELDIARDRYCACYVAVPEKAAKEKLGGMPPVTQFHREHMRCGS